MREADTSPNDEEPEILQSGTSGGKVLHLSEDDNDFILDVLDMVIERLSALEAVVQRVDSRLAGGHPPIFRTKICRVNRQGVVTTKETGPSKAVWRWQSP